MRIVNPYDGLDGAWLKGQLHVHTTNSDGAQHPHETIRRYEELGYDFLALTDHRRPPSEDDLAADTSLVVIPGEEYVCAQHSELGVVGLRETLPLDLDRAAFVGTAVSSGAFVIFNHPTWHIHHWPIFSMLKIGGAHALEVYNAVVDLLPGAAECPDKWDRLLTSGVRIFAVATDDAHTEEHRDRAWVMVSAGRDEGEILAALKAGRFYASSGPLIDSIHLEGNVLTVESPAAQEIRFVADRGCVRHVEKGTRASPPRRASYEIRDDDIYVRAELYGDGASKAWTQPVFVESDKSREKADEFRNWYLAQQAAVASW